LLKKIKEYEKYVAIAGFRNVKIASIEDFLEDIQRKKKSTIEVQFFDAKLIATWQHLYFASLNALTAFKNKVNISKSLAMETMLFASAQRQIRKATELIGIKPDSSEIAVLIIGEEANAVKSAISLILKLANAEHDDDVLMLSEEKINLIRRIFEISDSELEAVMAKNDLEKALTDLIIERMALLATER
jgi:KEOPS complex subunit Cgi121